MLADLAPALNYPQHIQSVQPVDIREAVQKYLSPDAYGVLVVRPKAN
jgi:zinc protease